jgi:hypothetical protein
MIGRSFLNLQSFSHHKASAVVLIREVADGYEADAFIVSDKNVERFAAESFGRIGFDMGVSRRLSLAHGTVDQLFFKTA